MPDTHFIQYYDTDPWFLIDNEPVPHYSFNNGFSSIYKLIKNKGDFIWLKSGEDIPVNSGKVYISLQYKENGLEKIIKKANENPKMKIIIGGPYFYIKRNIQVPENIKIIEEKTLEDYFSFDFNQNNWGLELPKKFENIGYNFSLIYGRGCYWGECTYCKWGRQQKDFRILPIKSIPIIDHPGTKFISLRSSSLTENMVELFSSFPKRDDVFYNAYLRGDKNILLALKKVLPKMKTNNLIISMGIELPCNEILNQIQKGTTKEIMLDTIKILSDYGIRLHFSFMLGWNNLKWEYISEVKEWFSDLSKVINLNKVTALLYRLYIVEGRPIMTSSFTPLKHIKDNIYVYILDDEQYYINERLRKTYHSYFGERLVDLYNKTGDSSTLKRKW